MNHRTPFLSVIVPAHQGAGVLRRSLEAVLASDLPRESWELIVVDDASTDATSQTAAQLANVVVSLPGRPRGPAYARNRGAEVSRGTVLVFVDADVCVHPSTLRQFAALFAADAGLGAAFGSYDDRPGAAGLVSQFRNLMHHHVHQQNPGEAETFWAGCGAVRHAVFRSIGMFDEWHYARPQIEDIELGRRMRRHGHRILLCPDIQCTHLKRWTLRGMVETDFRHRGVPWTRLILHEGPSGASQSLNLRTEQKWCVALALLFPLLVLAAVVRGLWWPLHGAGLILATLVGLNRDLYAFFRRVRGLGFATAVVPLHLAYYMTAGGAAVWGTLLHVGKRMSPAADTAQAREESSSQVWPPPPARSGLSIWDLPVGHAPTAPAEP